MIPILDDWNSLALLLPLLDENLALDNLAVEVIAVDDGSSLQFDRAQFAALKLKNVGQISVLELKRNLGHQRAITIGLAFAAAERDCTAVLVMDGDGEDDPADILKLLDKCRASGFTRMIFARRSKRSEGLVFRVFYQLYTRFFKLLTGQRIRVGNFSIVPRRVLRRLVVVSEVWNHYAVGALKARVPYEEIDTRRGRRLSGKSKMNFVSLVTHGLSAVSVYGDIVGVRLLLGTSVLIVLSLAGVLIVFAIRLVTELAIPGWASYLSALLLIILMQAVTLSLFFIFLILNNRNSAGFLPERDYQHFIQTVHRIEL